MMPSESQNLFFDSKKQLTNLDAIAFLHFQSEPATRSGAAVCIFKTWVRILLIFARMWL